MRRNTLFECTDVLKINSKKKFKKNLKKPLTRTRKCGILIFVSFDAGYAGIAQLAEQLICNQQVAGSSPIASSILWITEKFHMDGFPSGQREQTVNLPSPTSVVRIHPHPHSAGMAELADALDSGSSEG